MHQKQLIPESLLIPALAHELRTPLNAISGWVEILATDGDNLSALQRKALAGIERAMNQQVHILDGLQGRSLAAEGRASDNADINLVDYIVQHASDGNTPIALQVEDKTAPVYCRDNGSLAQTVTMLTEVLSRAGPELAWQIGSVTRAEDQPGEPAQAIRLVAITPEDDAPDLAADATLRAVAEPGRLSDLQEFPRQLLAAWRIGTGLQSAGLRLMVSGNRLTLTPTGAQE